MNIGLIQEGQNPVLAAIATDGTVTLMIAQRGAKSQVVHLDADTMAALCDAWLSRIECDPNERVAVVNGKI